MHDEDEEDDCYDHKYHEKKELESENRDECEETRDQKWYHQEYDCYNNRTQIEEDHCEVESSCYCDISHSESCWCWEWFYGLFLLKNNKKLGVGEADIDTKCEQKIDPHHTRYRYDECLPKEPEQENIEGDDSERSEYSSDIVYLKYREKMSESIKKSLPGSSIFLSFVHLVWVHHLDHPTSGDRLEERIENENGTQKYNTLTEIVGMYEFAYDLESFIFFIKNVDIGECQLIEHNHKKP